MKAKYSADKQAYYGEIPDIAADKLSTMRMRSVSVEGTAPITDTVKEILEHTPYIYSTLRTSASEHTESCKISLQIFCCC